MALSAPLSSGLWRPRGGAHVFVSSYTARMAATRVVNCLYVFHRIVVVRPWFARVQERGGGVVFPFLDLER